MADPARSADRARRRQLREAYRQARPQAAVCLIRNRQTGKALLGSTTDLASLRNRLDFARSTGTASALDGRLRQAAERFGLGAFSLEVVETLDVGPEMSDAEIRTDPAALEALCREQLDPSLLV